MGFNGTRREPQKSQKKSKESQESKKPQEPKKPRGCGQPQESKRPLRWEGRYGAAPAARR